jgi:spermidine synthase
MKPRKALEVVATPDGGELVLWRRDDVFEIHVDGLELMSSRAHGSEEALAQLACGALPKAPRVLIGGLGFGFTTRAALDVLPPDARVTVAEFFAAVESWNRDLVGHLARHPLADRRLRVEIADVKAVIDRAPAAFDAILLDVDNGPEAFTLASNRRLYGAAGLASIRRALAPGGVLAVWSASPDMGFVQHLSRAGFTAACGRTAYARAGSKGGRHTIFLGTAPRS